jgi:PKD repeat protein
MNYPALNERVRRTSEVGWGATVDDERTQEIEPGETQQLTVTVPAIPPLPGYGDLPQDLDGDGLYEDVNGDGTFDIFDVQALFENLNSDTVQQNAEAFNFDGDGPVDIFDVQALFERL